MQIVDGVVRVVFMTVALCMGVNFIGLHCTIHYGTPSSTGDYFQEKVGPVDLGNQLSQPLIGNLNMPFLKIYPTAKMLGWQQLDII